MGNILCCFTVNKIGLNVEKVLTKASILAIEVARATAKNEEYVYNGKQYTREGHSFKVVDFGSEHFVMIYVISPMDQNLLKFDMRISSENNALLDFNTLVDKLTLIINKMDN